MRGGKSRWTLVFLVLMMVSILWWAWGCRTHEATAGILTSGFIEAKDVAISPEIGGRIIEISADEGDNVKAGTLLVRLDDSLLKAQQKQAETNVKLAQAYLNQAIVSRDGAKKAWENAFDVQRNPLELEARIIDAQGELAMAELNLVREKEVESSWRVPAAEIRQETAEKILDNLQLFKVSFPVSYYTINKEILPAAGELETAKLALAYEKNLETYWRIPAAELRRDIAKRALENLLAIKENPQEIKAAVDQAYSAYQSAVAAVTAAERQVELAQASLAVIEVQLGKFSISSPVSGVVAARNFEVGEMAQPGASILTVTELEEVTLTAYVPESKIGRVKLGQVALVSVDSYPGETFSGEVAYISPRALFTPKNIQLKEEREKMVFAVKIKLMNLEQKLKPGMPADVNILTEANR